MTKKPRLAIGMAIAGLTALTGFSNAAMAHADADSAQLMGLLPAGFNASNCKVISPIGRSLATVDCGQNRLANGPSRGSFLLFTDQASLDDAFNSLMRDDVLAPCPNGDSPGTWSYGDVNDGSGGQIACGTYKGKPDLLWTQNADHFLGAIGGSDIASLYGYWADPGESAGLQRNGRNAN